RDGTRLATKLTYSVIAFPPRRPAYQGGPPGRQQRQGTTAFLTPMPSPSNLGKVRHTASPDGGGIHIGFRGVGRDRHRRSDLVCNLVDNAAGASPSAAARRRER